MNSNEALVAVVSPLRSTGGVAVRVGDGGGVAVQEPWPFVHLMVSWLIEPAAYPSLVVPLVVPFSVAC
ncbi:MAG TPA: hypothetical protein VGM45_00855 [Gaiellaceae bacterium]